MKKPLVSVIVLCHNHEKFVAGAIKSVIDQQYDNIELIVVNDGSSDGSVDTIEKCRNKYDFTFLSYSSSLGNCKAFNHAYKNSRGEYIIDLAADDLLLPDRVASGVETMAGKSENYGVHFCDVLLCDEHDKPIQTHYLRDEQGQLIQEIPQGWVFKELVQQYFICTPSMMIKREVLDQLDGYDESLSYEDFDFWVRSSRHFRYAFTDAVLVKKRIVKHSLSNQQKSWKNRHITTTATVCEKAIMLCRHTEEFRALQQRLEYEIKWALWTGNVRAAWKMLRLWVRTMYYR